MPDLEMSGAFPLSTQHVVVRVTRKSAGNYALGYVKGDDFFVQYVGRSDSCVRTRLANHAGSTSYRHFMFSYATSPKAAFEKECWNYHDFGETDALDNLVHPRRPDGASWKCPVCDLFD